MLSQAQIEMHPTNLVSELRAEVMHWWEELQKQQQAAAAARQQVSIAVAGISSGCSPSTTASAVSGGMVSPATTSAISHGIMSPLLGHMLGEGPLRMISSGQELFVDMDERTLADLHMTDGQVNYFRTKIMALLDFRTNRVMYFFPNYTFPEDFFNMKVVKFNEVFVKSRFITCYHSNLKCRAMKRKSLNSVIVN